MKLQTAQYTLLGPVAATVADDPSLSAFEINNIRLHGEHIGRKGAPVIIAGHGGPF